MERLKFLVFSCLVIVGLNAKAQDLSSIYGSYAYENGARAEQDVKISAPGKIVVPGLGTGDLKLSNGTGGSNIVARFANPDKSSSDQYIYCYMYLTKLYNGDIALAARAGSASCNLQGHLVLGGQTTARKFKTQGVPLFQTTPGAGSCADGDGQGSEFNDCGAAAR